MDPLHSAEHGPEIANDKLAISLRPAAVDDKAVKLEVRNVVLETGDLREAHLPRRVDVSPKDHRGRNGARLEAGEALCRGAKLDHVVVPSGLEPVALENLPQEDRAPGNQADHPDGRPFEFRNGLVLWARDQAVRRARNRSADNLQRRASLDGVDGRRRVHDGHLNVPGDQGLNQGIGRTDQNDLARDALLREEPLVRGSVVRELFEGTGDVPDDQAVSRLARREGNRN